jgi:hypothetical protein
VSERDPATDERESDEARDREAILGRRKALIAAAMAGLAGVAAVTEGCEQIERLVRGAARPCLDVEPQVCLAYMPTTVDAGGGTTTAPMPCLSPREPEPMACLSVAIEPQPQPRACLSVRRR